MLSIVVEHGPRAHTGPRRFSDLLSVDGDHPLVEFAPAFKIMRIQLVGMGGSGNSEGALHDGLTAEALTPLAELTLGCLARSHDSSRLATVLADLAPVARRAMATEAGDALLAIRTYIWAIIDEDDVPAFQASVDALGDDMGTAAQNLIARGREEGREEGARALFLRLVTQRFGPLADEQLDRIRAADLATIERWGPRVLTAESFADVVD